MASTKKYWKGIEQLEDTAVAQRLAQNEFVEEIPVDEFLGNKENLESTSTTRRDFLKFMGFSTAAATLAACETPINKSIPYVVKPEEITPGVPNYYASTFDDGRDYASILVKTREGRPIKIEPNNLSPYNSTNARIQASVLSLYDAERLAGPQKGEENLGWSLIDEDIIKGLTAASAAGKDIVVLTSTLLSPSTKQIIKDFAAKYPGTKHVSYDAVSYSGLLDANKATHGMRALPAYHFDKAGVVVSFAADFLNNWAEGGYEKDYVARRNPDGDMSYHVQFEANMSLTGSNADKRVQVKPSQTGLAIVNLYNEVAKATGNATLSSKSTDVDADVKAVAAKLVKASGKSIVVAGSNDTNIQLIVNGINMMLNNYGRTIDFSKPSYAKQGNDAAVAGLMADMKAGKVGALLAYNVNPVYSMPNGEEFAKGMEKVGLTVSFASKTDETAAISAYKAPTPHYLEAWGDANPRKGYYSLMQPTIQPLFNTRQMQDSLLVWMGSDVSYYDYLKSYWTNNILDITTSWNTALHDGSVETSGSLMASTETVETAEESEETTTGLDASAAASAIVKNAKGGAFELVLYEKTAMGTGEMANNPWLQELPDPLTRTSWDNYITMSPTDASANGFVNDTQSNGAINGNYASITVNGTTLDNVPVYIQPGQAKGTIGLAVGYGRTTAGKVGNGVGVNAYPLMHNFIMEQNDVAISAGSNTDEHGFACIQLTHTMMGRKIVNETDLATYLDDDISVHDWNHEHTYATYKGNVTSDKADLWQEHDKTTGHFWNLSIDLNSCIGCGACIIACHAENNVPVVGKEEIRRSRDMHWLRIDRYYSSDMTDEVAEEEGIGAIAKNRAMEDAAENPQVVFQPVMCQHCNHAPCETVCPVAATTHSAEGLNHMAYNRCVGTRYCANNCPYKVRRFNWFQYSNNDAFANSNVPANEDLGKMVLNPDVTVRSRGVMEKCSMCIQRIQYAKLDAKKAGRKIEDGEFTVACAQACSTGALEFGDANNKDSKVAALKEHKRMYHLLDEIGTKPSVFYQTKVRNRG